MGALDGIRVVEVGLLVQGPQAAAQLGIWGADVIKVELPGFGDQSRWLPIQPGDTRSGYFVGCNRGKRSITIDLRKPQGAAAFLRLTDSADVLITNFTPGTMEGWGLGHDVVGGRNPKIVYACGSTYGPEGPDASRAGADLSAQAVGGLVSTTGTGPGSHTPVGVTIADHIAAQNVVGGVLAALLARERTGRGQRIDTSLLGGQIWAQSAELTACLMMGRPAGPANRGNPLVPGLYGIFTTADGAIAIVGVVGQQRGAFFEAIGRPELAVEFATPLYFDDAKQRLFPLLDEIFATRTTAEWSALMEASGIRYAPVRDHAEVVADEGAWANGYIADRDDPTVMPPVRFSDTPARLPGAAPELGQHTEEVLLELGFSWAEITALAEARAI